MKKLLILSALFISCSFSSPSNYYATTWDGMALNEGITITAMNNLWVTYGNTTLPTGGYPWCDGCTLPSNSLRLMTRSYFESNYGTIGLGGPYLKSTSKTSNQILVKSDIGIQVDARRSNSLFDCTGFGSYITLYINSDFTKAYTDPSLTTLYAGGGLGLIAWRSGWTISGDMVFFAVNNSGVIVTIARTTC